MIQKNRDGVVIKKTSEAGELIFYFMETAPHSHGGGVGKNQLTKPLVHARWDNPAVNERLQRC